MYRSFQHTRGSGKFGAILQTSIGDGNGYKSAYLDTEYTERYLLHYEIDNISHYNLTSYLVQYIDVVLMRSNPSS